MIFISALQDRIIGILNGDTSSPCFTIILCLFMSAFLYHNTSYRIILFLFLLTCMHVWFAIEAPFCHLHFRFYMHTPGEHNESTFFYLRKSHNDLCLLWQIDAFSMQMLPLLTYRTIINRNSSIISILWRRKWWNLVG